MEHAPSSAKQHKRGQARALVAAALVLVLGLIITATVTTRVRTSAHDDAHRQFDNSAEQAATAVERELQSYTDKLRDIAAFVANSQEMSPQQFHAYAQSSKVFEQIPSMSSLFYLRRVPEADLQSVIAAETAMNPKFSLFQIGEHVPGRPYLLLTHYEPGSVDLDLPIGTDAGTIPSVWAITDYSAQSGDAVVGSFGADPMIAQIARDTNFPLIQALVSIDFFIGVPVYGPASADSSAPHLPIGWSAATVDDFRTVVAGATAGQPDSLGVGLTVDLTAAGMGNRADIARVATQEGDAGPQDRAAFTTSQPFQIDGVDWKIDLWSSPTADDSPMSVRLIQIAGATGSLLAAALVYARIRARERERDFAVELADRAQFQRDILDSVTNPMVVLDAEGRIRGANPAWAHLRDPSRDGEDEDADVGRSYLEMLQGRVRAGSDALADALTQVLSGETEETEADIAIGDGARHHWYAARATRLRGSGGGAVMLHTDITERKRSHDELELKASRDNLTGLLNRLAFEGEVDSALLHARAQDSGVAVLFIDLDGFKPINDTYGHAVGDDVLRSVAQRITSAVRTTDRVARLGGDEFVVLIAPLRDLAIAEGTADRVLEALSQPVRVGARVIPIAASIGIASVDAPLNDDHTQLIDRADHAMYVAKQQGGSRTALS